MAVQKRVLKNRIKRIIGGFLCLAALAGGQGILCAYAGEEGQWDRSEDGKHWQYMYSPGEPVCEQWISWGGNYYYLDKKGNMKTGWFTDPEDQGRYYLGEDGAMKANGFLPDGSYAGPDGRVLKTFGTWKKAMESQLKKMIRLKEDGSFVLADLNGDGYRDLAVFDTSLQPSRLFLAAMWDDEEGKLLLSAEGDGEGDFSYLSYNPSSQTLWFITESLAGEEKDYFVLEDGGPYFEHIRQFKTEWDDWGDPCFYVDGDKTEVADWEFLVADARQMSGEDLGDWFTVMGLSPWKLNEDSVALALNQPLAAEELPLWQD